MGLTLEGARWIAGRGLRLVGTDYLSIQRYGDEPETHRVLMRPASRSSKGWISARWSPASTA